MIHQVHSIGYIDYQIVETTLLTPALRSQETQ